MNKNEKCLNLPALIFTPLSTTRLDHSCRCYKMQKYNSKTSLTTVVSALLIVTVGPPGYWESLLQQLKAHMARTRLREMHQENLRRKLFKLKEEVIKSPTGRKYIG